MTILTSLALTLTLLILLNACTFTVVEDSWLTMLHTATKCNQPLVTNDAMFSMVVYSPDLLTGVDVIRDARDRHQ